MRCVNSARIDGTDPGPAISLSTNPRGPNLNGLAPKGKPASAAFMAARTQKWLERLRDANVLRNSLGIGVAHMTEEDLAALEAAVQLLEIPGLAARLTDMLGKPIELIGKGLPASVSQEITAAAFKAIELALKAALLTMRRKPKAASKLLHKALATATGTAGGAFGLATLPIELPVSTLIMLRSIADIARSEGENLSDPETALSCVQVFAL